MTKKRPKQGTLTRRADEAFSKFIRQRDGYCRAGRMVMEGCTLDLNLQCAHGFTRARFASRWAEWNAWALCRSCHVYFTYHPEEWTRWLQEAWGTRRYWERYQESLQPWRGDKVAIAAHYKQLLEEAA